MYTALIVMYALTASIAGYVAASYYKQMEGELWVRNILLTCFVYCGPFFTTFAFLNTVAIAYRVRGEGRGGKEHSRQLGARRGWGELEMRGGAVLPTGGEKGLRREEGGGWGSTLLAL